MQNELMKGNVPGLILAVLRDGPLHGYAIAREIERRSDGALGFKEGSLYPALHALEKDGFVEAQWDTSGRGAARKTYGLTSAGNDEWKRRQAIWNRFAQAVGAVWNSHSQGEKNGA